MSSVDGEFSAEKTLRRQNRKEINKKRAGTMNDWAFGPAKSMLHYGGIHSYDRSGPYFDSSCAITQNSGANWWTAKMAGGPYDVQRVTLWTDMSKPDDLVGAKVYVGNTLCNTV